ncbi:calcium-dependent cysteine-type endopeptidase [Ascochyta rabiei]|uniref:Calcium-dependent cysteine-type endopeptidase n=1 Tax=Didymella rabiei TaxID=5454 RepID=A0A163CH58_DIDRA|nr:calcium-dependent cysteine-type endopeptidase [Ascochyta rabiei]
MILNSRVDVPIDGLGAIHRVDSIFDNPKFKINDLQVAMSYRSLIKRACVAQNERCGVYGFAFYRDGEWIWNVVDDNMFITKSDFDARGAIYDPTSIKETMYKRTHQTGSEALYFASCAHENETWLPLLDEAYAKINGDYDTISGGVSCEAVEDLTEGVTSKILTARVLDKECLWKELKQVNTNLLFSASSLGYYGGGSDARRGLAFNRAYSIINAVDASSEDNTSNHQLVLIRRCPEKLDERYFRGLAGKYMFDLHYILQEKGTEAGDYISRACGAWFGNRSISADVLLEPGVYEVLPKIEAKRNWNAPDVHEVVTKVAERNLQKLRQMSLNYDIANAKETVKSKGNMSASVGAQPATTVSENGEISFGAEETKCANTTGIAELLIKTAKLNVDDKISSDDSKDTEQTCIEGLELHSCVLSRPAARARPSALHLCRDQPA